MKNKREVVEKRISSMFSIHKIIPSAITLSALCFGLTAIRFGMLKQLDMAVLCILLAALFDAMDGRAARFLGASSQFGAELDSLSDLVSFGVAPGILMYMVSAENAGKIGWIASLYFVICCALRLARFNVGQINDAHNPVEEKTPPELKVFFTGVPAPAGAVICLLPLIAFLKFQCSCLLSSFLVILVEIVAGTLMISKIHTFSSKMIKFDQRHSVFMLLGILLTVMSLVVETWGTILAISILYVVSIPFGDIEYKRRVHNLNMMKGSK